MRAPAPRFFSVASTFIWSRSRLYFAARRADVDMFVGTSRYFAELMRERLHVPEQKVRFVYNGINLAGYTEGRGSRVEREREALASTPDTQHSAPILGFFARMCRDKG